MAADYDFDPTKWKLAPATPAPTATASPDYDPKKWKPAPASVAPAIDRKLSSPTIPTEPPTDPNVDLLARTIKRARGLGAGFLPDHEVKALAGAAAGLYGVMKSEGYHPDVIAKSHIGQLIQKHPFWSSVAQLALFPPAEAPKFLQAAPAIGKAAPEIWGGAIGAGQYGSSALAQRVAPAVAPGHKGVQEAISAGAGLAAPLAMERYAPSLESALTGAGTVTGTGMKAEAEAAATKQREANVAELQKRREAAVAEVQKQKTTTQTAAEAAGATALKQRQKALETAQTTQEQALTEREAQAQAAHDEMERTRREAQYQRDQKVAAAYHAESQNQRETLAAQYAANQVGTSRPTYGVMEDTPARADRDVNFRNDAMAGEEAMRDEWHKQREASIGPYRGNVADLKPLTNQMDTEETVWRAGNRGAQGPAQSFWNQVRKTVTGERLPTDEELISEVDYRDPQLNRIRDQNLARVRAGQPPDPRFIKDLRDQWQTRNPSPAPQTVNDLLKTQQEAKNLARRTIDGPSKVALNRIVDGIDESIKNSVPEGVDATLDQLNRRYFSHRLSITPQFERRLNTAAMPLDAADAIFTENPQRALDMWDHAEQFKTPQTQDMMRQMFAEKALDDAGFVGKVDQKIMDRMFKGDKYLTNRQSWIYAKEDLDGLADYLDNSPSAEQSIRQNIVGKVIGFDREMAKATVTNALKNANAHGTALGNELKAQIKAAESGGDAATAPQRAAAIVEKFYAEHPAAAAVSEEQAGQVSPEQQLAQQPRNVREPGFAASAAGGLTAAAAPRTARESLAEIAPTGVGSTIPGQPGVRTGAAPVTPPGVTRPEEATGAALGKGYQRTPIYERFQKRAQIWGTVSLAMPLIGRFSGYAAAGMAEFAALFGRERLLKGIRQAMADDPATLKQVMQGLHEGNLLQQQMRGTVGRAFTRTGVPAQQYLYDPLTRAIARSIYADGMARMNADQSEREEFDRMTAIKKEIRAGARTKGATSPAADAKAAGEKYLEQFDPTPTATPTPERTSTGPGVKAADRMRAEAIAPSKGSADDAQKLAMNVSKTNPINIHRALTSGRHSTDEIKQTLQFASNARAGDVLAGISLPEAMSAVEMADPGERQMLLPVLLQRLKQELPRISNKTTMANLSQRFQRLQQLSNGPTGTEAV